MKKISCIISFIILVSCGQTKNTLTYDEGIIINKIKWATRNVDEVGTFTDKSENLGKFYQWNRKKAWNTTDIQVEDWDSSYPVGFKWEGDNDPSPKGWRLPTYDEIKSLLDDTKVNSEWVILNGVKGRKFTCKESGNSLFLPAAGGRGGVSSELLDIGILGGYWSDKESGNIYAEYLFFNEDKLEVNGFSRRFGKSIRSVSE